MKTAIVTGGGTGIGLATCRRFLTSGYRVIAAGLERDDDLPAGIEFLETNVTDPRDIDRMIGAADRIDALIHCAGIQLQEREWQVEDFRKVLDVNLTACHASATAALDKLTAARGNVVNIASMWSFFGSPKSPGYAASKNGIVALTRSMATAWAPRGIRANAVAPGWVLTRMAMAARSDPVREPRITERIPMARWAEAHEVANVIHFLASDEASYVTGVVLPVDGGYSIG
ncbi:SDR family NAD(P)-dependent oxidoreductase [Roseisalinus antarcticus]|uniref:2-dehydro-3-deoxy-D-gluconate 5-dehydrogenase n=1 Tax=Roseisalinus antarcticus TaxID=254357 RepID=A0A1Y5TID9_9RHOB|nr:SDR family oxidoreductase [Roseisalinus antarcticus]SLN64786.1 2-dehydro-3-deoxy-D-gluconate 5-dehydrogenase [Roseisalinus antarcticus]